MWWLIPIGIATLIGAIAAAVTDEEREARDSWERKREEVRQAVQKQQEIIDRHFSAVEKNYNFHALKEVHYASVLVANAAYKLLRDASMSLEGIGKMLVAAKAKREELFLKRKKTRNRDEKEEIQQDFDAVIEFRASLFKDKDLVKGQRDEMLLEVKRLNNQTHKLKELVRDKCGEKGIEWYNRIEQKKALR
jgi:hypothetical protein